MSQSYGTKRPAKKTSSTNRSTNSRATKRKTSKNASKGAAASGLGMEVGGLIVMAIAFIALLGILGVSVGSFGEFLTGIFTYGFGIGGLVPCLTMLYFGWQMLYNGTFERLTMRRLLFAVFFLLALALVPLVRVPAGKELLTTQLANQGGIAGGLIASLWRSIFSDMIAIFMNGILVICAGLLISRLSLSNGLHLAKEKTAPAVENVKVVAGEQLEVAKERFQEWKEERKERRRAYNQEQENYKQEVLEDLVSEEAVLNHMEPNDASGNCFEDTTSTAEIYSGKDQDSVTSQAIDAEVISAEEGSEAGLEIENSEGGLATGNSKVGLAIENSETDWEETPSFTADEIDDSDIITVSSTADKNPVPESPFITETETATIAVPSFEGTEQDRAAVSVTTDGPAKPRRIELPYHFPSLNILSKGPAMDTTETTEVAQKAAILENTLKSFGIIAKVVNATKGPAVTRYELEPAPGTKVSRIVNLTDDLKLSLAAPDIRMEAPIPGKSAIGIEVPNSSISAVHLRDVLDCSDFLKAKGGIPVGLGKDIAGKPIITDLAKMPHLLVAGSTGSGKSVCINTLISSILFSRKPSEVKLILIDPKVVELSVYNGIPHLMTPVVTDMKKAASVLRWAVKEMEARYRAFATSGVRDITRYNEVHPDAAMPLVVIIIDELADLMMTAPADIEESICRLAQMARAAGLHMVLATQRPSVNVITGTIKANVPSRISFAVATQIDSRTILDMGGAEKLLGKGDMLFNPIGASKPIRIQGAFITDDEVEALIAFMKKQGQPEYDESVTAEEVVEEKEDKKTEEYRDELLERAVELVMDSGQASVSMLQRRFRIGYTRAARLVDTMEEMKIVGPNMGSKARDILMTAGQAKARYFSGSDNSDEV